MPYTPRPDGLGLADTRKSIYNKIPQVKATAKPKIKPKVVKPRTTSYGPSYDAPSYNGLTSNAALTTLANAATGLGQATYSGRTDAQLRQMANEAVNLDYLPKLHGLQHGVNVENQDYGGLINKLRKQLGLSQGDVKQLYSALDVNLKASAQKQKAALDTAKTAVGSTFDQLQSMLGSNYTGAIDKTNSELSRLGIQDSNATSQLANDQQFMQGIAGTDKANAQSVLDQINASGQSLAGLLQGSAASAGTVMQGQLQQTFDQQSGDAGIAHKKALDDLKGQINEMMASHPGEVNQTYQALLDQEYQRQQDAAQGAFDNNYKLAQLGLQQQTLSTDTAYKQNTLALGAQKLQNTITQAAQKAAAPKSGLEKAMTYLAQHFNTKAIPSSELQRALIDIVNGDTNTGGGRNLAGFDPRNLSEYAKDAQSYVNQRGYGNDVYTALINAMHYLFGK